MRLLKLTEGFHKFSMASIVCSMFILSGCGSMGGLLGGGASAAHSSSLVTGSYDQIHIPAYSEYEILGPVFATTEEYIDIKAPYMTYLQLLSEAAKLGGHAIVNVSIEESKNCIELTRDEGPYKEKEKACRTKRFGHALAIKYTKPILEGPYSKDMVQSEPDSNTSSKPTEDKTESSSFLPF